MIVSELLENLTQQGIQLWVDNEKLRIHSPKGILTPELQMELAKRKAEILLFLQKNNEAANEIDLLDGQALSLQTIGRLIGGFCEREAGNFSVPIIDPEVMAKKLKVTFRPLPNGYKKEAILKFREALEFKLQECGVQVEPWERATKEFCYEITIPIVNLKKSIKTRVVKAGISAVIDVERRSNLLNHVKTFIAEQLYQFYSHFILKNRKISASKIAQFIGWAEENIQPLEDPTNTQSILLTEPSQELLDSDLPYEKKIPVGVKTLVKTFSEIIIGVTDTNISILNMNLSDSVFPIDAVDNFVFKSLIPKIYVPILPMPMSRFELGQYDSERSIYTAKLVQLGKDLAATGLLPAGFKIDDVVKRKSHRDIVDWMVNGRTGVSYGFVAYVEPPQYIGSSQISQSEWERLSAVPGLNSDELRQNEIGRRYIKTRIGKEVVFKQLPDIWLVSSRSGANKTDLKIQTDILRIGLKDKLYLQLPQGIELTGGDIKPSYDIYVMVSIALATALYAPELIREGAPIFHFHGYPSVNWFEASNEYCTGVHNPSVPCGTYESGVFNFLGMHSLVERYGDNIALASLIEPDHGTNIIAHDSEYLLMRLKTGIERGQIELGGKHFSSLKESITAN